MHISTNYNVKDHPNHAVVTSTSSDTSQAHCSSSGVSDSCNARDEPPPYYLTPQGYYIGQDAAVSVDVKEKRDQKCAIDIEESSPAFATALELQDQKMTPWDVSEGKQVTRCCFITISTRCIIIGLFLSIIILAGGASMVTGSALVSNQCMNDCGSDPNMSSRCSTVCSQSLHKGLLVSGILIIILAAISTTVHFVLLPAIPFLRWMKNYKQQNRRM